MTLIPSMIVNPSQLEAKTVLERITGLSILGPPMVQGRPVQEADRLFRNDPMTSLN